MKKIAIMPETTVEDLVEEHPAAIRFLIAKISGSEAVNSLH